jgi:hypothetical protein
MTSGNQSHECDKKGCHFCYQMNRNIQEPPTSELKKQKIISLLRLYGDKTIKPMVNG